MTPVAAATSACLRSLSEFLPRTRLLVDVAQRAVYASDALTAYEVAPSAVALPRTQAEVVEIVRCCRRFGVPFVARGSGTSLSGGSLPVEDGILIALNRLDRIIRLDPDEGLAVVEPGVLNLELSRAAAPFGLYYAPDPSSQTICTIGGNVAFSAGGAHCLKYGMTTNHVLGIRVVLPDGEVVELGGDSRERVGPDLVGLFVGSEGLLGIALEITVRLLRKPEQYRTILAAYRSLEAAGDACAAIVASGLLPAALEIMDRLAIEAAVAAVHVPYPRDAEGLLIVELDGEALQVEEEFERLQAVMQSSGAYEIRVAADDAERAAIWKGRKSAFSAVGRLSPDFVVNDGVVPRSRLGEALREIGRLGEAYGLRIANVFHAGDGNLHPLVLFDGSEAGALERAEELAGEILDLCIRLGGSITGEHGVGMEKRAYLPRMYAPADIDVLRRLHDAIDPAGLSNRGKVFMTPGDVGRTGVEGHAVQHGAGNPGLHGAEPEEAVPYGAGRTGAAASVSQPPVAEAGRG
jgi:glycolate oxidase